MRKNDQPNLERKKELDKKRERKKEGNKKLKETKR